MSILLRHTGSSPLPRTPPTTRISRDLRRRRLPDRRRSASGYVRPMGRAARAAGAELLWHVARYVRAWADVPLSRQWGARDCVVGFGEYGGDLNRGQVSMEVEMYTGKGRWDCLCDWWSRRCLLDRANNTGSRDWAASGTDSLSLKSLSREQHHSSHQARGKSCLMPAIINQAAGENI